MTNKEMQSDPLFHRNTFSSIGRWEIPLIKKQEIDLTSVELIAYSDIKKNDIWENRKKGVHYYIDDYRFNNVYFHPENNIERLIQYNFVISPDFSTYPTMPLWRQMESVAHNRWCGAFWQSKGITVVPSVGWSGPLSYEFCFDGIEQNSIISIGMIGCKHSKIGFLKGYSAMLERLNPSTIICFGSPFKEMKGNIIVVDYKKSREVNRHGR